MSKKDNSVRNWREYNRSLIKRGDITCWIDVNSWYNRDKKLHRRGRPHSYDNTAIVTLLVIKAVYHLTLRSCQGFAVSLFKLLNIDAKVPDYSTICRRQKMVALPKFPCKKEPIHLVIDSSGLKIFGEGEWKVRRYGQSKRRMWAKLHLGIDEKDQIIVSPLFTGNNSGDDKKLPDILQQYKGPIRQVSLDGAYDSHECYDIIGKREAKAVIPPQPNPKHKPKTMDKLQQPRDFTVYKVQQLGLKQWKMDSGYHRRSLAETGFYRYKKLISDKLSARTFENQRTEALIGCHILNRMMKIREAVKLGI